MQSTKQELMWAQCHFCFSVEKMTEMPLQEPGQRNQTTDKIQTSKEMLEKTY